MGEQSIEESKGVEATAASLGNAASASESPPCDVVLSFVHRYTGESGREYVNHWNVVHSDDDHWNECVEIGAAFFAEIEALAARDEVAAFDAMHMAVMSANWSNQGWGEECGFAWRMASAAMVGLRAIRAGSVRFQSSD